MKRYDAWLFDADGTLFDTRTMIYETFCALVAAYGRPVPDRATVDAGIGLVLAPMIQRLLGPLSDEELKQAMGVYRDRQLEIWQNHLSVFPGVAEGLRTLRSRGARMAVVTSRTRRSLVSFLDHTGLADCFDALVTPEDTRRHKPDPEPARYALQRLGGIPPERAVMIGDAEFDIQCGHSAGTDTVLVAWGGMDPATFPVPPDRIIRRFDELL